MTVGWPAGSFMLAPQDPLLQTPADMAMTPVGGATEPNVCMATLAVPPNTPPGKWTFKLRTAAAADFRSLGRNDIGDILILLNFQAS